MSNFGVYYNDNDPYCVEWLENLILFKLTHAARMVS